MFEVGMLSEFASPHGSRDEALQGVSVLGCVGASVPWVSA